MDSTTEQLVARLRENPKDLGAYDELRSAYREAGDIASLVNLLEGWAGQWPDNQEAAAAYTEAGQLVLEQLDDTDRAFKLLQRALHRDHGNSAAADALIELLKRQERFNELAEFLDNYLVMMEGAQGDPLTMTEAYLALGEVWETRFEQPETARQCYARACELTPNHIGAIYRARKLAETQGDLEEAARLYTAEAAVEPDPARRINIYSQLAKLHADLQGRLDDAIRVLRGALNEAPGDVQVMDQLARYLLERAKALPSDEAERDHRRAGELLYQIGQGLTDEPDQAIGYLQSALAAVPNHGGALGLLEDLAAGQRQDDLLPPYWIAFLEHAGEGIETERRRILLARAYAGAGQLDDAIYCLEQITHNAEASTLLTTLMAQRDMMPHGGAPEAGERLSAPVGTDRKPRAPRLSEEQRAEHNNRVLALRKEVHQLVTARSHSEAAERCKEIIALDPGDTEAFNFLESQYRKMRSFGELRDLLLTSTRAPGLSADTRRLRLNEVAVLSENKLQDVDSAITAYQGVVMLDPSDVDAGRSLRRLLERTQRWDDLVALLERQAAAADSETRERLLEEIAALHREHRNDPVEWAATLRQLHALRPEADHHRDRLRSALRELGLYEEAVPLFEATIAGSEDPQTRLTLQRELAEILDERVGDDARTYAVCDRILSEHPGERSAFDRMVRIDERGGHYERLFRTLGRRADAVPDEQAVLYVRMSELAGEHLDDLDKAADCCRRAVAAGASPDVLTALARLYERAERYEDLVELLRERVRDTPPGDAQREARIELARALAELVQDEKGARAAYLSVLESGDEERALRYLLARAEDDQNAAQQADYAFRLQALLPDQAERRERLLNLAALQEIDLAQPQAAIASLRVLLEEVDPECGPAVEKLLALCEANGDDAGLTIALERQLATMPLDDHQRRAATAQRLADLTQRKGGGGPPAIRALSLWAEASPNEAEPHRRLRPLLEQGEDGTALQDTLDALAQLEDDEETIHEATLASARCAFERRADADGAWTRLLPLVTIGDETATDLLTEVCRQTGWADRLANLHVDLAQKAGDPAVQLTHWRSAAGLFDRDLASPERAFEAALRGLAIDLADLETLGLVDDLAVRSGAWRRLAQVYERVLGATETAEDKVALIVRHADLLEGDAGDPGLALDRMLQACRLAPESEELLARAESLAGAANRNEDMLAVYEQRRDQAEEPEARVEYSLRCARLCDGALQDRKRAERHLEQALVATEDEPALGEKVYEVATELDENRPELGAESGRRALLVAHGALAESASPEFARRLVLRATSTLRAHMEGKREAYDMLCAGVRLQPEDDAIYAALVASAKDLHRVDELDGYLDHLIEETIDSHKTVALLQRRGALLEAELKQPQAAARVYSKLLQLRPNDQVIANRLRKSLKRAGRHRDLLVEISKQLPRAESAAERLRLLREAALTWEHGLKNRFEAREAWEKVAHEDPEDVEAQQAIERLAERRTSRPDADLFAESATLSEGPGSGANGDAKETQSDSQGKQAADDGGASTHEQPADERTGPTFDERPTGELDSSLFPLPPAELDDPAFGPYRDAYKGNPMLDLFGDEPQPAGNAHAVAHNAGQPMLDAAAYDLEPPLERAGGSAANADAHPPTDLTGQPPAGGDRDHGLEGEVEADLATLDADLERSGYGADGIAAGKEAADPTIPVDLGDPAIHPQASVPPPLPASAKSGRPTSGPSIPPPIPEHLRSNAPKPPSREQSSGPSDPPGTDTD